MNYGSAACCALTTA